MEKQYITYAQATAIAETGLWDIDQMQDADGVFYDCPNNKLSEVESTLGVAKRIADQNIEISVCPRFTLDEAVQWFREIVKVHIQMINQNRKEWTYDLVDLDDRSFKDEGFTEFADLYEEIRTEGFKSFSTYNGAVSDAIDKVLSVFAPQEYEEPDSPVLSEEDYTKLCEESEKMNIYDGRGDYHLYECEKCGHHLITAFAEKGVTPFVIKCPECNETMMHTKTYGSVAPDTKVLKWIRPTYNQYIKLSTFTRQHIEQGGLILETMIED